MACKRPMWWSSLSTRSRTGSSGKLLPTPREVHSATSEDGQGVDSETFRKGHERIRKAPKPAVRSGSGSDSFSSMVTPMLGAAMALERFLTNTSWIQFSLHFGLRSFDGFRGRQILRLELKVPPDISKPLTHVPPCHALSVHRRLVQDAAAR